MLFFIISLGTSALPEPRIRLIFSSASSNSQTDSSGSEDFPLFRRQSSDTEPSTQTSSAIGGGEGGGNRFSELLSSEEDSEKKSADSVADIKSSQSNDDSSGFQSLDDHLDNEEQGEPHFLGTGFKENHLLMKMYGVGIHSDEEEMESTQDWMSRMRDIDEPTTPRGYHGRSGSFETIRENAASLAKEERRNSSGGLTKVEEGNDPGVEADDEGLRNHQASRG